jgi:hypothetical protein
MQEMVADAVLGKARGLLAGGDPRRVRLVLAEQQRRFRLGVEVENAELRCSARTTGSADSDRGTRAIRGLGS